jgi:hypothetical protein
MNNVSAPQSNRASLRPQFTNAELADARAKLSQAQALVSDIKAVFFDAGAIPSARLLNEVMHSLDEEISVLDRKLFLSETGGRA